MGELRSMIETLEPCLIHKAVFINTIAPPRRLLGKGNVTDPRKVERMREYAISGHTIGEVAEKFNVSTYTSRKYVGDVAKRVGNGGPLTAEKEAAIKRLLRARVKQVDIAEELHCSVSTVNRIAQGIW